jgi:hypothetical protein
VDHWIDCLSLAQKHTQKINNLWSSDNLNKAQEENQNQGSRRRGRNIEKAGHTLMSLEFFKLPEVRKK